MKPVAVTITLLFVLAAVPLAAQDRAVDLTLWASQVDVQGTNRLNEEFETEFESGDGFGLSTNIFLTPRISTEVAAFKLSSDAGLAFAGLPPLSMGSVKLLPLSAGVQFHPAGRSRFDPYIGAGAAYVLADDMESRELTNLGVGALELDNDLTYYVNAGVGFHFMRRLALVVDGRYIPYKPTSRSSVTGGQEDLDLTTLFLSAGLRFRF